MNKKYISRLTMNNKKMLALLVIYLVIAMPAKVLAKEIIEGSGGISVMNVQSYDSNYYSENNFIYATDPSNWLLDINDNFGTTDYFSNLNSFINSENFNLANFQSLYTHLDLSQKETLFSNIGSAELLKVREQLQDFVKEKTGKDVDIATASSLSYKDGILTNGEGKLDLNLVRDNGQILGAVALEGGGFKILYKDGNNELELKIGELKDAYTLSDGTKITFTGKDQKVTISADGITLSKGVEITDAQGRKITALEDGVTYKSSALDVTAKGAFTLEYTKDAELPKDTKFENNKGTLKTTFESIIAEDSKVTLPNFDFNGEQRNYEINGKFSATFIGKELDEVILQAYEGKQSSLKDLTDDITVTTIGHDVNVYLQGIGSAENQVAFLKDSVSAQGKVELNIRDFHAISLDGTIKYEQLFEAVKITADGVVAVEKGSYEKGDYIKYDGLHSNNIFILESTPEDDFVTFTNDDADANGRLLARLAKGITVSDGELAIKEVLRTEFSKENDKISFIVLQEDLNRLAARMDNKDIYLFIGKNLFVKDSLGNTYFGINQEGMIRYESENNNPVSILSFTNVIESLGRTSVFLTTQDEIKLKTFKLGLESNLWGQSAQLLKQIQEENPELFAYLQGKEKILIENLMLVAGGEGIYSIKALGDKEYSYFGLLDISNEQRNDGLAKLQSVQENLKKLEQQGLITINQDGSLKMKEGLTKEQQLMILELERQSIEAQKLVTQSEINFNVANGISYNDLVQKRMLYTTTIETIEFQKFVTSDIAELLKGKKIDEAIAKLEQFAKENNGKTSGDAAQLTILSIYFENRQLDAMYKKIDELVKDYPASPLAFKAMLFKAEAKYEGGDTTEAIITYRQIMKLAENCKDTTCKEYYNNALTMQQSVYEGRGESRRTLMLSLALARITETNKEVYSAEGGYSDRAESILDFALSAYSLFRNNLAIGGFINTKEAKTVIEDRTRLIYFLLDMDSRPEYDYEEVIKAIEEQRKDYFHFSFAEYGHDPSLLAKLSKTMKEDSFFQIMTNLGDFKGLSDDQFQTALLSSIQYDQSFANEHGYFTSDAMDNIIKEQLQQALPQDERARGMVQVIEGTWFGNLAKGTVRYLGNWMTPLEIGLSWAVGAAAAPLVSKIPVVGPALVKASETTFGSLLSRVGPLGNILIQGAVQTGTELAAYQIAYQLLDPNDQFRDAKASAIANTIGTAMSLFMGLSSVDIPQKVAKTSDTDVPSVYKSSDGEIIPVRKYTDIDIEGLKTSSLFTGVEELGDGTYLITNAAGKKVVLVPEGIDINLNTGEILEFNLQKIVDDVDFDFASGLKKDSFVVEVPDESGMTTNLLLTGCAVGCTDIVVQGKKVHVLTETDESGTIYLLDKYGNRGKTLTYEQLQAMNSNGEIIFSNVDVEPTNIKYLFEMQKESDALFDAIRTGKYDPESLKISDNGEIFIKRSDADAWYQYDPNTGNLKNVQLKELETALDYGHNPLPPPEPELPSTEISVQPKPTLDELYSGGDPFAGTKSKDFINAYNNKKYAVDQNFDNTNNPSVRKLILQDNSGAKYVVYEKTYYANPRTFDYANIDEFFRAKEIMDQLQGSGVGLESIGSVRKGDSAIVLYKEVKGIKATEINLQNSAALQKMGEAVANIHSRDVFHSDLHAENIFYDPKLNKVTIIDFDRSKITEITHQQRVMDLGTLIKDTCKRNYDCGDIIRIAYNKYYSIKIIRKDIYPELN
jgi:tRNA A-37 threonylcarbamoyl transferase component Bud32